MVRISRDVARQIARIANAVTVAGGGRAGLDLSVYRALRSQKAFLQNRAACQASMAPDVHLVDVADGYTATGSRAISTLISNALY